MPFNNDFRHQDYRSNPPSIPYECIQTTPPPATDSRLHRQILAETGERFAEQRVAAVYLVHGTLAGSDMSGLIGLLGRFLPDWSRGLKEQQKRLIDNFAGDWGNYDARFAQKLSDGLNTNLTKRIEVERFMWSSENHHLGRSDGAVRLIEQIHAKQYPAGSRILLWGHSHGGNLLAIMTNLLGGTHRSRSAFFQAASPFFRSPTRRIIDLPVWGRVRDLLANNRNPFAELHLDIATFGTPIRYGWDTGGYASLIHIIQHRPAADWEPFLVPFPPTLDQIYLATHGDFFQQFFVAGTNFPQTLFSIRNWRAERRLVKLLQAGHLRRDLWTRLKTGMRVPDEGRAYLIDYESGDQESARSLAGHAVYTMLNWLPFHLQMVRDHWNAAGDA